MLAHVISRIVLDRTCPVCNGLKEFKKTKTANYEMIECSNCKGKGNMYMDEPVAMLVPDKSLVPGGLQMSMETQNVHLVDTTGQLTTDVTRMYVYNVSVDSELFKEIVSTGPKEIHCFFSEN